VRIDFAVLADFASVTDGKLNVLGIFQEVNADQTPLPRSVPHMYFVALLRVTAGEVRRDLQCVITHVGPSNSETQLAQLGVSVGEPATGPPRDTVANIVLGMGGFAFETSGLHKLRLSVEDGPEASASVFVWPPNEET
jgi:hypothetical protein